MLMLVLGAFFAAAPADVGTHLQQVPGMHRAAGHQRADVGAVAVKLNAAGHHFHIVFLQAGGSTGFAGGQGRAWSRE